MAATETLITRALQEYSVPNPTTNTEARARMLKWFQSAEDMVCSAGPWWFLEEEATLAFVSAQSEYELPDDYDNVLDVYDDSGNELQFVDVRTFDAVYRPFTVSDTPKVWAFMPRNQSTRVITLYVWPQPSENVNGRMRVRLYARTLADSDSNYSRVPEGRRQIIQWAALMLMAQDDDNPNKAQFYKALYDEEMTKLQTDHQLRRGARK